MFFHRIIHKVIHIQKLVLIYGFLSDKTVLQIEIILKIDLNYRRLKSNWRRTLTDLLVKQTQNQL